MRAWPMVVLAGCWAAAPVWAAAPTPEGGERQGEAASRLERAKRAVTEPTYWLQYKFRKGETIRYKVVHLGTTETKIKGTAQTSRARSESIKRWEITDVDEQGNMTLVHAVEKVDMWQHLSGRPEVRYRSDSDEPPPPEYEQTAKTVGVPLTVVTISPAGEVLRRESKLPELHLGLGAIVPPLPERRIKVGDRWSAPSEIRVRLPDRTVKVVKTRQVFTLQKVETGVATIRVRTEVITPVTDPRVEAQLVQQLANGVIKFDIEAGRIRSKQMDWDETVIGFSGPDSIMQYLARFTEELLPGQTASADRETKR